MVRSRPQVSKKGKAPRGPAPGLDPEDEELQDEASEEDVAEAEGDASEEEGAAGGGSDEDVEEEEEEEEEEETAKPKKAKKKKRSQYIDDQAGEADEDEEEEERGGKKKKAKKARNVFIDDEADAASDDEEDGDDDDDDGFVTNEADEAEQLAAARSQFRERDKAQRLERRGELEDAKEIEEFVKQRFGKDRARGYKEDEEEEAPVDQEARQPSVNDPKLWMVKCRQGKERETTVCLMQKWVTMGSSKDPEDHLRIIGVFSQDHLKGYIYVEAEKEPHVRHAIKGMHNVFHSQPPRLVPIREMVDSVSVTQKTTAKIVARSWCRVGAGTYKGDLCFVESTQQHSTKASSSNSATIKLIPRLDMAQLATREKARFGSISMADRSKKQRPPAKLFNLKEADAAGITAIEHMPKGTIRVNGYLEFRDGFLIKDVAFSSLRPEPAPPFEELQRFTGAVEKAPDGKHRGGRGDDDDDDRRRDSASLGVVGQLAALAETLEADGASKRTPQVYRAGDSVKIVQGDLKGITGIVASAGGDGTVHVNVDHKDLQGEAIALQASDLARHVTAGMHVRVTSGRHDGATGMVVRLNDEVVVLLTDILKEEIQVFSRDLVEAGEASTGADVLGPYGLHDLVILEGGVPGVIVKIEHQAALVLSTNGTQERPDIRTCRQPDIQRKIMGATATAQDKVNNTVAKADIVSVEEGTLRGKSGSVLWCHRGFVFLHCRDVVENGGVLCVRARSVKGPGNKGGAGVRSHTRPPQFSGHQMPGSPMPLSSPQHMGAQAMLGRMGMAGPNVLRSPTRDGGGLQMPGGGAPPGMFSGAVSHGRGRIMDDPLVSKRVKVCRGPYKGYKGIVIAATNKIIRLELEANEKTVTVKREDLDGESARPADVIGLGGMTPGRDLYGKTPMHPSMTPGRDYSMTPSREAFGMTPGREAFGMTPGRDGAGGVFGGGGKPATPGSGFNIGGYTGTPGNQYGTFAGGMGMGTTPGGGWGTGRTPGASGTPSGSHQTAATPDTSGYAESTGYAGTGTTPLGPMPGGAGQWDARAQELPPPPRSVSGASQYSRSQMGATSFGVPSTPTGQSYALGPLMPGVVVQIPTGEVGVVASVAPDGHCRVDLQGGLSSVTAPSEDLMLAQVARGDHVVILEGPHRGRRGIITGRDDVDDDWMVQFGSSGGEQALVKNGFVGKLAKEGGRV